LRGKEDVGAKRKFPEKSDVQFPQSLSQGHWALVAFRGRVDVLSWIRLHTGNSNVHSFPSQGF